MARPAPLSAEARLKGLGWFPSACMGALLLAWWLAPRFLNEWMFAPLLLSVVLLGIPHGALDLVVPGRLGWAWGRRWGAVAVYGLLYAALVGLTLLLWRAAPTLTFWGFLLLTLLHWGQGDLHALEYGAAGVDAAGQGRRRAGWWSAPLALLARGSLPVLVPLLFFPQWFGRLLDGAARVFGVAAPAGPLLPGGWALALGLLTTLLLLAYAADTRRCSPRPARELGEAGLLLLVFAAVPAPLSIGVYFACWHAWRHLGRLRVLPEGPAVPLSLSRLTLDLLPITLLALLLLGGLYLWAAPRTGNVEDFAALYLALIAALTVPHALLVALMDVPVPR